MKNTKLNITIECDFASEKHRNDEEREIEFLLFSWAKYARKHNRKNKIIIINFNRNEENKTITR